MDFENESQRVCYENIKTWLTQIFGEFVMTSEDSPMFAVRRGSALAEIGVFPWRDQDSVVNVRSWVVTDVENNRQLMDFLLKENNKMFFGGFGLDENNDVLFQHSIVGSTCDKEELKASVFSVAAIADDYDDRIISRWGGQTAADRWE